MNNTEKRQGVSYKQHGCIILSREERKWLVQRECQVWNVSNDRKQRDIGRYTGKARLDKVSKQSTRATTIQRVLKY